MNARGTLHRRLFLPYWIRLGFAIPLLLWTVHASSATPPDVMTLVDDMKAAFEPARPSIRKVVISVSSDEGYEDARWVAAIARKKIENEKRRLIVMLEPASVEGIALLIRERPEQEDAMWTYSPAVQRVRKVVAVDAYERFLRTDFTYSDLGFVDRSGQYRLLGQEKQAGVSAYKIEEVPKDSWYYSRIVTWIAMESHLPLRRDYYDRAGQLWKTERFDQVVVVDGVPTPLRIRMHDVQENRETELQMSEVRYDVELSNTLFDPERLPEVATLPLWRPYRTQVSQEGESSPSNPASRE
jgi:hypothetical protein